MSEAGASEFLIVKCDQMKVKSYMIYLIYLNGSIKEIVDSPIYFLQLFYFKKRDCHPHPPTWLFHIPSRHQIQFAKPTCITKHISIWLRNQHQFFFRFNPRDFSFTPIELLHPTTNNRTLFSSDVSIYKATFLLILKRLSTRTQLIVFRCIV